MLADLQFVCILDSASMTSMMRLLLKLLVSSSRWGSKISADEWNYEDPKTLFTLFIATHCDASRKTLI